MHKYTLISKRVFNLVQSSSSTSSAPNLNCIVTRSIFTTKRPSQLILGIETSCDDTGAAIVDTNGNILGEGLNSQLKIHLQHGGIIPPLARHLHEQQISKVIQDAFTSANLELKDIDAVATTVKPGLLLSLLVGIKHGKELSKKGNKPFIPIHHMEAHALTVRMIEEVNFPYMVLLVSGGHSLLAIAKGINQFLLLGTTIDDAPGEAFDKTARRLKIHHNQETNTLSGGAAIEYYAKEGNPEAFEFPTPMNRYRDCNWSFSGLKFIALRHILREERKYDIEGPDQIPTLRDLCASFQHAIVMHLCKKIQRGIIYSEMRKLIPENNRVLAVSGGVACNQYVKNALNLVAEEMGYKLIFPPNKLCTDNGVMIAWNGVEKYKAGIDIYLPSDLDMIDAEAKCPMGVSLQEDIRNLNIKCKRIKMNSLYENAPERVESAK